MGKLKLTSSRNNYPIIPNTFKLCIELSGESIKLSSDKSINLKTSKNLNHFRVATKITYACDMLLESIELR